MKTNTFFSRIITGARKTEWLKGAKSRITGKWHLLEYYTEGTSGLNHFSEKDLSALKEMLVISILRSNEFVLAGKFPVAEVDKVNNEGIWDISGNYITLIQREDANNKVEFQYAFNRRKLKLLKKDQDGRILFFGIFKKENPD